MASERTASEIATGYGIIFGGTIGMIGSLIAGADATTGLIYGPSWGIITGSITGMAFDKGWIQRKELPVVGAGWGGTVGAAIGVVAAWSREAAYVDGLTAGISTGILGGVFLGMLTSQYLKE